jgi:hypothetical protein
MLVRGDLRAGVVGKCFIVIHAWRDPRQVGNRLRPSYQTSQHASRGHLTPTQVTLLLAARLRNTQS